MRKYLKIGTVVLVIVCLLAFFSIPVSAADSSTYSFNVPFSKPEESNGLSYFEVVYYDSTYTPNLYIIFLNQSYQDYGCTYDFVIEVYGNSINVIPMSTNNSSNVIPYYVLSYRLSDDTFLLNYTRTGSDGAFSIPFQYGVAAVYPHGVIYDDFSNSEEFIINYSSSGPILDYLKMFSYGFQNIESILNNLPDYSSYLDSIFRDTSSLAEKMAAVLDSNETFYQRLDSYFQDSDWSLLTDISSDIYDLKYYLLSSPGKLGLFDYLLSMNQTLTESKDYLQALQDIEQSTHIVAPDSDSFNPDFNEVSPPRDDSTIQDIEDAEQEALGGLTQEEIKEQVDETFDTESKIEEIGGDEINVENITIVNNLFGDMFSVFGGAWSTYFVLNLTIAFAAFLIGRRY